MVKYEVSLPVNSSFFKHIMFKIELILCKIKTLYVFHNTKHHVHYSARVIEPKMIRGPGRIVIARGCTVNASGGLFLGGHVHLSENACIF